MIFLLGEYDTLPYPVIPFFNRIVALMNDGTGHFPEKRILHDEVPEFGPIAVYDVDADGAPDLLFGSGSSLVLATNDGTGHFPDTVLLDATRFNLKQGFGFGDLNGNGLPDLVLGGEDGLRWRPNRGGGAFGESVPIAENCFGDCAVFVSDWDNDLDDDLFLYYEDKFAWYPQQGPAAAIPERQDFAFGVYANNRFYRSDLNLDGAVDLLVLKESWSDPTLEWYPGRLHACGSPKNLRDSLLNDSTVQLAWDPVPAAQGYRIRIGTRNGAGKSASPQWITVSRWFCQPRHRLPGRCAAPAWVGLRLMP